MKKDHDQEVSKAKHVSMSTTYHGQSMLMSKKRDKFTDELFSYANNTLQSDFPLCIDCIHTFTIEYEKEYQQLLEFYNSEFVVEFSQQDPLSIDSESTISDDFITKMEQDFVEDKKEFLGKEEAYFTDYNEFVLNHYEMECEKKSIMERLTDVKRDHLMLHSTFLLNEVFHIWFDGFFGCINNFRVGKLSSQPVEWSEINAGLGYMVLLLDVLATKLNIAFSKYQLVPFGSFSCIASGTQKYDFFGGNGGYFWSQRFDKAMIGFYTCLKEMMEKFPNIAFPYEMKDEKIHHIPFKYSSIDQDKWTKVMKYCLTNLKWILVYLAK